jgi:hypothetical protein
LLLPGEMPICDVEIVTQYFARKMKGRDAQTSLRHCGADVGVFTLVVLRLGGVADGGLIDIKVPYGRNGLADVDLGACTVRFKRKWEADVVARADMSGENV